MRGRFLHRVLQALLVVTLAGALSSCGVSAKFFGGAKAAEAAEPKDGPGEEETKAPDPVRLVGEIASVHAEEGFVLIRRYAQGHFSSGELISSLSPDGKSSSLRLTGEKRGRYYAADIQEGTPEPGDLVVVRRLPDDAIVPATPLPQAPGGGGNAAGLKNFPPS